MSLRHTLLIFFIAAFLVLAAGCTQPAPEHPAPETPAITMTVPFPPIPVESTDGINLAYELEFSGTENMTFMPRKVEVIDPATGEVLYTADGTLLSATLHPAAVPPPTAAEMQNGTAKLSLPRINLWFKVAPGAVPDRLTHRVTLNRTADGLSPLTVTGGDVAVRKDLSPVVVGAPVRGDGWGIIETTSPLVHHAGSQITINGVTRVPQRYAQDFIYLDPATGQVASGDETVARNYYGFGKELYAVDNGTVVYVSNGVPDIEITTEKPPATIATALGNGVVIDLGDEKYACYGHMVNGSVRVKVGDTVTEGQVIGLMGNTGNSDVPHLHFQVITGSPVVLGAEGYPIVYRSFNITGTIFEDNETATIFDQPIPQEYRLMENDVIVSFP
ncbi:hypothetical protein J2741_000231 [Methanolinea mesophila]|uniref:M23 family metallopeptidase n=1 Tax=Methanolinea mesophila TaxID=547055 RepID=UPI001AE36B4F|nr:M23 family metallopeptidase [Methanolinea mesophila]MBP1927684.1 hypothetical protein [Methanolinea mesophila]